MKITFIVIALLLLLSLVISGCGAQACSCNEECKLCKKCIKTFEAYVDVLKETNPLFRTLKLAQIQFTSQCSQEDLSQYALTRIIGTGSNQGYDPINCICGGADPCGGTRLDVEKLMPNQLALLQQYAPGLNQQNLCAAYSPSIGGLS
ncbi:hypothetical protein HZB02_02040 [Candidatus Woesearchaeota archaeon]|nr:hypothetical protein [Candidatus Woesearchaeota archaeon]